MTTHTTVPSDLEPESLSELVDDCREVSGVLAPFVADLPASPAPTPYGNVSFTISRAAVEALDGYDEYGS